jgi:hypothetical protein
MSIIKSFLGMVLVLFLLSFVFLVPAILTGSLLRLVFPSMDRGMSILIGLVATVSSIHLITRFTMDFRPTPIKLGEQEFDDDDDDDDDEEQEPEASHAPRHPPAWTLPSPERPSW